MTHFIKVSLNSYDNDYNDDNNNDNNDIDEDDDVTRRFKTY
jgi:hypothetical protein